ADTAEKEEAAEDDAQPHQAHDRREGARPAWLLAVVPAVAVILSRPRRHRALPGRSLPRRAPVRHPRGRLRGLRKVAHHGIQVSLGLGRERLVEPLVQFLERQSPVRVVFAQLGGDCFAIGVPDAHVVSRSHRALRSKSRGIPYHYARYIARDRTASELPRAGTYQDCRNAL